MIDKRTEGLENKSSSGEHPNYSIFEVGQNTEMSPGDLTRLSITQTLTGNDQLTLVLRTWKGVRNNSAVKSYNL